MKGLRFQKRIKLFGGTRLNLSKSGIGISTGVRGTRFGIDAKGRSYSSLGLPGTGGAGPTRGNLVIATSGSRSLGPSVRCDNPTAPKPDCRSIK
jgi:hypothetical protein